MLCKIKDEAINAHIEVTQSLEVILFDFCDQVSLKVQKSGVRWDFWDVV